MRIRVLFAAVMVLHAVHGYAEGLWETYTTENSDLRHHEVYNIAIDHNNTKWVMSRKYVTGGPSLYELQTYNSQEWKRPIDYGQLPGNSYNFTAIAIDYEDNVWLGQFPEYLIRYDLSTSTVSGLFKTFELFGEMTGNITDMVFDNSGLLWLTLPGWHIENKDKVCTFNGESAQIIYDNGNVHGLACDSHNTVWGTAHSNIDNATLFQFDGTDVIPYSFVKDIYDTNPKVISSIISIDHNDIKWLSAGDLNGEPLWNGLVSFIDNVWTVYTPDNTPLPSTQITDIAVDHNNNKWIGTDAGLVRFDGENWEVFTTENSGLVDNKVRCLAVEDNNTLWIGTEEGLSKYTGDIITAVDEQPKPEALPTINTYPNPFNPTTTISFTLPENGHATLTVYNLAGQTVRTLADEPMAAGSHTIVWDGCNDAGNAVAAGVYVTRLDAGGNAATGKMVLVK